MLPADIFLALRYLRPKRSFLSVITLLSILGPAIGVAVLIIVMSIMNGFHRDIRRGILDVQAHLRVHPRYQSLITSPGALCDKLKEHNVQASPLLEGNALMQLRESITPLLVRGISPEREKNTSFLARSVQLGKFQIQDGEALIGIRMAVRLHLNIGDTILVHSPSRLTKNISWKEDGTVDIRKPEEMYLPEKAVVAGIYSVGIADFDDNLLFLTLDQTAELFGHPWDTATSLECRVPDPMNMLGLASRLQDSFPDCTFITWQQQNQMLFNALQSEKNLMTFLLAFIVLIAAFSISATLITVVVKKTREIGILKAVGFSRWAIARVFFLQGIIIGFLGTALGTLLGMLVLKWRQQIATFLSWLMGHDIFPAELYHLNTIPSFTATGDLIFTVLLSLGICVFASLLPAMYASSLLPANSLHEDN